MDNTKKILDACCGSRMMWFDRNNSSVLFTDIRTESHVLCDGRTLDIRPDLEVDFRNMPFNDNSFRLIAFDPPHMKYLGATSWMAKKYGVLSKTWQDDIKQGVRECMRVLMAGGVLVFKWNESQVTLAEVLSVIDYKPLFGHTSGRHGKTIWLCFMKPDSSQEVCK